MKLTVDRIDNLIAVCECEDMSHIEIFLSDIPFEIKEGSVINVDENGTYTPDPHSEEEQRRRIIALRNKFKNRNTQ